MNIKNVVGKFLFLMLVLAAAISARANSIAYNVGDVLLCIRTVGGTYDLEVNCGPISTFTNLAIGQKITISQYTGAQLAQVGTNSIFFTAFAHLSASNTLFMSAPRHDLNTQSTPYFRALSSAQGNSITVLRGVANTLTNFPNDSVLNNSTAGLVLESRSTSPYICYNTALGPTLDFNQTFQADPEQSTSATFTMDGQPVRADFYRIDPYPSPFAHPPAEYLGYFEFSINGVMTYTAGPSPTILVAPTITSIARSGTTNTITFTTSSGGTYVLCGTNNLMRSVTNWPALNSVAGDGSVHSLADITTNSPMYYTIRAQ